MSMGMGMWLVIGTGHGWTWLDMTWWRLRGSRHGDMHEDEHRDGTSMGLSMMMSMVMRIDCTGAGHVYGNGFRHIDGHGVGIGIGHMC